jgi:hypothetical protein
MHRVFACVVVLGSTGGSALAQSPDQQSSMISQSQTKSAQGPHLKKVDTLQRDGGASGRIQIIPPAATPMLPIRRAH